MRLGRRQRRWFLGISCTLAGLLALWLSLPVWFPWILGPLAQRQGLRYSSYERAGYSHIVLLGVGFTNQNTRFRAERVEMLQPGSWLWRSAFGEDKTAEPFVSVQGWQLEVASATNAGDKARSPTSVYTSIQSVATSLPDLERWLPSAVLSNGTVRVQEEILDVPRLAWSQGKLRTQLISPRRTQSAEVTAILEQGKPFELRFHSESLQLESLLQVSLNPDGVSMHSTNSWRNNPFVWDAKFSRQGALPENVSLPTQQFTFPAELIQLHGYRDINGSVSANWQGGQLAVALNAESQPAAAETNLPPLKLDLQAHGDTETMTLARVNLSSPGLSAELSRELTLYFKGTLLRQPASLKIAGDLAQQTWVPLQGTVSGTAELEPTAQRFPAIRFELSGVDVASGQLKLAARKVRAKGTFDWPRLEISKGAVDFEDGSTAQISGDMDLKDKAFGKGTVQFEGPLARRWLPEGFSYENVMLAGNFSGPYQKLIHTGHLVATNFTRPQITPLQIKIDWTGEQAKIKEAAIRVEAGKSSLSAQGGVDIGSGGVSVLLNQLSLQKSGQAVLELTKPSTLSIHREEKAASEWSARVEPFHLAGSGGELELHTKLDWPRAGDLGISIQHMASSIIEDFVKDAAQERLEISNLVASANWTNGPATYVLDLSVREAGAGVRPEWAAGQQLGLLSIEMRMAGAPTGLSLSNLVINSETSAVAVAQGFLPLNIDPSLSTNRIHFDSSRELQISVMSQPHPLLWSKLADLTGVELGDPGVTASLSGTWAAPQGQVQVRARQIKFRRAFPTMPAFDDLRVAVEFNESHALLKEGHVLVQGQPVSLTGELPLTQSFWTELKQKHIPDWEKGSARLRIEHAEIAAFQPLFPTLLNPQGQLDVNVEFQPGGKLEGEVALHGARTRPLPSMGPIRDIEVKMKLSDRVLKLESATASVGGSVVAAQGQADLRGTNWLKGGIPPFNFAFRGTNVPLSRQPDSIIRSDLNLTVTKADGAPPLITGVANLQNSFYMSDVAALVPGKVATPGKRPPFFSIDEPSLADWRLGVKVTGDRFLRVRSTLFQGQVSANLAIQGTLKDPIAIGYVKIDSGAVRFPFASLAVQQGLVTVTSDDPYRPQLMLSAASKRFGYEVKMSVSGPADEPVIQFTSTPPLSSEQLVLMLTAGEIPRSDLTMSSRQKAQTVALFLGKDLLAKLGFGDEGEERLTIRSGEEVSERGTPTYSVEYKLSERWALVGEYDRFNAFNAGLKWRVYSK